MAIEHLTLEDNSQLDVDFGQFIAKGGQADVYKGTYKTETVAVKVSKDAIAKEEMIKESQMLDNFQDSQHIIKKRAFKLGNTVAFLALELAAEGDLYKATEPSKKLSGDKKVKFMLQIAHGLKELHAKGIVHGDLKAANVFICKSEIARILKIGDLGSAYEEDSPFSGRKANGMCIDPALFATASAKPTKETDMYSFAMTVKQLYGERLPKDKKTPTTSFKDLGVPNAYIAKLEACLSPKLTDRPTAAALYEEFKTTAGARTCSCPIQ
ncbi:hypothetical protein BGZ65_002253 [Modicella reniformis]|uniref:Protein kinase domain-containing protein n=1 Tax=Modicella reniformis TaxID=1440133 RepID=A0A9P6ILF8_9FUNG|nr:hypothetical protein BGZ65_002253 [Modicella reniformis]